MRAKTVTAGCLAAAAMLCSGAATGATPPGPTGPTPSDTPVPRIVTLAPHATEMVFAAGAGRDIVATVSSSDYPAQALRIPRIGNGIQIDVERIVALRPDLVIAWRPMGAARTLAPIASRLHIPILYLAPKALREIPADIAALGRRLGTAAQASDAAARLSARIDALTARYAGRRTVPTFIEVGSAPLYTLGKDPLTNDVLHICGAANIYADTPIPAPQVSAESVLQARPDAVVIASTDPHRLAARTRYWAGLRLPAAIERHVYGIDPDTLFRPGPRLVTAAEALCRDLDRARAP